MLTTARLKSGLLKHTLEDEMVVYDPADDRVHLIDQTTAVVFDLIEEKKFTANAAADAMTLKFGADVNGDHNPSALVDLALEQLRDAGLLTFGAPAAGVDRREMIKKVALTGAAALLVPAVATLTATRGYAQATGSVPHCGACTSSIQCAVPGESCRTNSNGSACGNPGAPNGANCSNNGLCCSNHCSGGICVP